MNYNLDDTIVALSSSESGPRYILRISGPGMAKITGEIFDGFSGNLTRKVLSGNLRICEDLAVRAWGYIFPAGSSYTGQDMAELHFYASKDSVKAFLSILLRDYDCLRQALGGEFTARAYLNGRMDLAQAEAVAGVVTGSNLDQIRAAERLLTTGIGRNLGSIASSVLDLLSGIEANLDFTDSDIQIIDAEQGISVLDGLVSKIDEILENAVRFETFLELASVGVAGLRNVGKSSLVNKLLGFERSIIWDKPATTRDILAGKVELGSCEFLLFDCAGLAEKPTDYLDGLGQQAAIMALAEAEIVVFCVDMSAKGWREDSLLGEKIKSRERIVVGTKADLLDKRHLEQRISTISELFGTDLLPVSSVSGAGIDKLKAEIERKLLSGTSGAGEAFAAINARTTENLRRARSNLLEAGEHFKAGREELAAMNLRQGAHYLGAVKEGHIDEALLSRIFSSFCIGK